MKFLALSNSKGQKKNKRTWRLNRLGWNFCLISARQDFIECYSLSVFLYHENAKKIKGKPTLPSGCHVALRIMRSGGCFSWATADFKFGCQGKGAVIVCIDWIQC